MINSFFKIIPAFFPDFLLHFLLAFSEVFWQANLTHCKLQWYSWSRTQQILNACRHNVQVNICSSHLLNSKKKNLLLWQLVKTENNKPLDILHSLSRWTAGACIWVQPGNRRQGAVTSDTVSESRERQREGDREREGKREGGETGGATTHWWLRGQEPTEHLTYLQDSWLIPCMK